MNAKTLVPLVVALVLGALAAKLGRDMVMKRRAEEARVKMIRVVMATDDLAPGTVVNDSHLAVTSVPLEGSGAGIANYSFRNPADVSGRVVMAQIFKGQPVLETLLAPKGAGGGAQAVVPEGMRAITVEVNEHAGVAGLLVPGCRVDVVHTLRFKNPDGGDDSMMARTIAENLRVVAVGRRMSAGGAASKTAEPENAARSVTLLVTQEQAELIDLASHLGQPRLVLRNGLDEQVSGGRGVTLAELKRDGGPDQQVAGLVARLLASQAATSRPVDNGTGTGTTKLPSMTPPIWREVEVIRGGTTSKVRVNAAAAAAQRLEDAYPRTDGNDPNDKDD